MIEVYGAHSGPEIAQQAIMLKIREVVEAQLKTTSLLEQSSAAVNSAVIEGIATDLPVVRVAGAFRRTIKVDDLASAHVRRDGELSPDDIQRISKRIGRASIMVEAPRLNCLKIEFDVGGKVTDRNLQVSLEGWTNMLYFNDVMAILEKVKTIDLFTAPAYVCPTNKAVVI